MQSTSKIDAVIQNGDPFAPQDFLADHAEWKVRRDEREARERVERMAMIRASLAASRGGVERGTPVRAVSPAVGPSTFSKARLEFDPGDLPDVARQPAPSAVAPDETVEPQPDLFSQTGETTTPRDTPATPPHTDNPPGPTLPPVIPIGIGNETARNADPAQPEPIPSDDATDARASSVRDPAIPAFLEGCGTDLSAEVTRAESLESGADLGLSRNLQRTYVSGDVRASLVSAFPMMTVDGAEGEAACRLIAYLSFGSWVSETTGRLVLGNQTLADIAGVPLRPASVRADGSLIEGRWERGHRWRSGEDFLAWAKTWHPALDVTAWNGAAGFSREVRSTGFTPEMTEAIAVERATAPSDRRSPVSLLDGSGFGTRRQAGERSAARAKLEARSQAIPPMRSASHLSERLIRLNNGGRPTLLRSVVTPETVRAGYAMISDLPPGAQRQTDAHLDAIHLSPKQLLKPTTNSVRPYPDGPGLNGLTRSVRDLFTSDLHGVDWAKAQFAINAWLYDIEPLTAALGAGDFDWRRFTDAMGVAHTPETERIVKGATYSLNFGGSDKEVLGNVTGIKPWQGPAGWDRTGISAEQAGRFLDEPLIQATRAAMLAAREKVIRDGGARDAFGDWIDHDTVARSLESRQYANPANSVLAQVAHSWELELMRPLVEILETEAEKRRPNVSLAVWLWDGAYLWIRQDADAHLDRIKTACDRHARQIGIPTTLEIG